jgi:hypothetical protein
LLSFSGISDAVKAKRVAGDWWAVSIYKNAWKAAGEWNIADLSASNFDRKSIRCI